MSRDELDRFLTEEGRAAVERLFAEAEAEGQDFDVNEVIDRNLYEAISRFDSEAGLRRWLSLRFTGIRAEGRIAEQAVEEILSALRKEITGASATKDADSLRLDLVGFSRGSAILYLAPTNEPVINPQAATIEGQQSLPVSDDQLDHALSVVTDLHMAAESGSDVQRFSQQESLLKGFSALADALDKHDLDMAMVWRSRTGQRRTSSLTFQGRDYVRQYFDRVDTSEIITINGRVVELDISGSFDVKTGTAHNSPRYKIATGDEESLLSLRLDLGQTVHIRIRKHTDRNKFGVVVRTRYEYLSMANTGEPLI